MTGMEMASLPEGWALTKVVDVCNVVTGGTPSTQHPEYYGGHFNWLKSGDIKGLFITETPEKLTQAGINNSNAKIHPPGGVAIALSGRGQTRGRTVVIKKPMACSQSVAIMLPNEFLIPEFLHYSLAKKYLEIRDLTGDNDRSGLNLKIVGNIQILLPPLPEQHRIADILTTVDEAIQRSRQETSETERFKAGIMEKMMTEGIGHTEFKEDPDVGKLPKEWNAVKFEFVMARPPNNGIWKNQEKLTGGYRLVRMTEFFKGDILDTNCSATIDLTEDEAKKYSLKSGDLLFGRRSLNVEGAGKCVIVPDLKELLIFESSLIRVALNKEIAYPLFFLYFMNGKGREQISKMVRTVSVSGITSKDLQNMIVPLPTIAEQQHITEILSSIDRKLTLQHQRTIHHEQLMQGLMNDLLTGRRRVRVT
jgi:type I restriction enzyme, S subunit